MLVDTGSLQRIEGGVTAPKGFRAAGVHCGLKPSKKDLALVVSEQLASVAATFTTNKVKAAPVIVDQEKIQSGMAQAIIVNSGNANACTGAQGLADAKEMAALTAKALGIADQFVLVASTGVIGVPLPMAAIRRGIPQVAGALSTDAMGAAEAILTTDAFSKTAAVRMELNDTPVSVGGMTKGAGMIHPQMATTLCFLTTDAAIAAPLLRRALRTAVNQSYNCISVDGDTSTNDSVFLLANALAGNPPVSEEGEAFERFQAALNLVTRELAQMVVRDGEGARKFVAITVKGARSTEDAKAAVLVLSTSLLVKTAFAGGDPNWGRMMAALGRSGAEVRQERVDVSIGGIQVAHGGVATPNVQAAAEAMRAAEFEVVIDLHLGEGHHTGWTCDLNEAYVKLNSGYTS